MENRKRPLRGLSYGVNHCCIKSIFSFHILFLFIAILFPCDRCLFPVPPSHRFRLSTSCRCFLRSSIQPSPLRKLMMASIMADKADAEEKPN